MAAWLIVPVSNDVPGKRRTCHLRYARDRTDRKEQDEDFFSRPLVPAKGEKKRMAFMEETT